MKPSQWTHTLLQRRGIERPDGRPLYQYKLSDQEFSDLSALLTLSAQLGVNNITNMLSWDAAFVMYGAEWWRRYYSGQWGWDGVFKSIDINFEELSIGKRNSLVESGLHRWRREVRVVDDNRRFLGTVATEGGLPLNQLRNSSGWLRNVLQPTLRKHLSRGINVSVLIDSYEGLIPSSYRSIELNQILTDITQTVVTLRQKYDLKGKEEPLAWLDSNVPDWRDLFPLPMDDVQAKSLLSDLIDTASRTRVDDSSRNPFEVERVVIGAGTPAPELTAQIDLPAFVYLDAIGFDAGRGDIPSSMNLEVYEPGGESWAWCRGIITTYRERKAIKLSGKSLRLKGKQATKELRLRFKHVGECLRDIPIPGGGYIDCELPWLFRHVDGRWIFYGAASQSVKDSEALVYVPAVCFSRQDEDTEVTPSGDLFGGTLMKLSGVMHCHYDDAKYRLSSGQEETVVQFSLKGRKCQFPSNPRELYIGLPELVESNLVSESVSRRHDAEPKAKKLGANESWKPLSQVEPGCYEIRLTDKDGNTQLCKRVGILAEDFRVDIKPDKKQVKSGVISLKGSAGLGVVINDQHIRASVSNTGGEDQDIRVEADEVPPISIDVSLLPQGQRKTISLTLPYPSQGALLFDGDGTAASLSTPLSLNNLKGYRLKLFDDKYREGQKVDLAFSLDDSMSGFSSRDIYIENQVTLSAEMTEFAIHDWHQYIDALISVGNSIDSMVQISLSLRGQKVVDLSVRRYESEFSTPGNGRVGFDLATLKTIDIDKLKSAKVSLMNLARPEQNFDDLEPQSSEGLLTGVWDFNPEIRQDGAWIIYPAKESAVNFRPMLWSIGSGNNESEVDTLAKAMLVNSPENRVKAIKFVMREMVREPGHGSWDYLTKLWNKTEHLPLTTFDIWRLTVSEPFFLASLLIHGKNGIVDRLDKELPVIWELVRVEDWQLALTRYQLNISEKLDDDDLVGELLVKKIESVEMLNSSLLSIGKILRERLLDEQCLELAALKMPTEQFLCPRLKEEHQNLLRRQADSNWPEMLSGYIFQCMQNFPNKYRSLINTSHNHQTAVTFLPWIMAWKSLSTEEDSWPETPAEVFKIQQLIRFDEDWFSAAFQYLAGWLSQQQLESL